MNQHLVFPAPLIPELLTSATSQAGARCSGILPNAGNGGAITVEVLGSITENIDPLIELTVDGDLQTTEFKYSTDSGATYLGRKKDSVWDDGASGGGNTLRTILATGAIDCVSKPVEIDSDADGVPDMVLIALSDSAAGTVKCYSTTDFSGAGAWTLRSVISSASSENCGSLIVSGQTVWAVYMAADDDVQVKKSINSGLTWGSAKEIAETATAQVPRGCLLANGYIAIVFVDDISGDNLVRIRISPNQGASYSTAASVSAAGADYSSPDIVQLASGKTICIFRDDTNTAIEGRQATAANPKLVTDWADYSETLGTFSTATLDQPSLALAPDDTVYLFARDTTGDDLIVYSKLKGAGTFPAQATVWDEPTPHPLARPACGVIGGALWCTFIDATDADAEMRLTKYWIAYDDTDAPASWTGKATGNTSGKQYLGLGLWIRTGGAGGYEGDLYEGESVFDYGAHRMICLRPGAPARSVGENAEWAAVFDLDAIGLHPVDTICAMSNLDHFHFQMNATNVWTSPSVNTTVSFVQETISSYTASTGKVTRSSGTWTPGTLVGRQAFFAGGTTGYRIVGNSATVIYTLGDPSAETGNLTIRSPRAWVSQTAAAYRYIRVLVNAQYTVEGYYQIPALFVGTRHALSAWQRAVSPTWKTIANDLETDGGSVYRSLSNSQSRRSFALEILKPTLAQYDELSARLRSLGSRPMALIPDTANAFDWALVHPALDVGWSALTTSIALDEVV